MNLTNILRNLPEVAKPTEKKLSFNVKLKWTLIVLVGFFVLANIPLYALAKNSLDRFEYLAIILGTDFGSIISLGIGPIVMASIILQLLVGAKIINIDVTTHEGKKHFQGLQKLVVLFFVVFEAVVYVAMQGLQAVPGYAGIVIIQLMVGGLLIVFMDELVSNWGFGTGVSLFIVAGVSWRLFAELFQFIDPATKQLGAVGNIPALVSSLINGDTSGVLKVLTVLIATIAVFLIVVWAQSLKVEIPLSFDRLRGYAIRWPLSFFYTSNIPVILTAALVANLQLFAGLVENWAGHATLLGGFSQGQPVSGLVFWASSSNILGAVVTGSFRVIMAFQGLSHMIIYMAFSTIFAIFWVKTSGMDARSQARNILASGLQIPGFRKDERILESILERYVMPLTVMGGMAVGFLASIADLTGALAGGTSILLAVMIMYQFYQNIAQQHAMDMHPALRGIIGA
ncbi:MAG TPA: preprotein translocase subunit SecY [Candidatus Nanoarchaeia archaeon]|nr:preprotein translocase subunit SecY [Candidatus Nanoarchaeia archaeon]